MAINSDNFSISSEFGASAERVFAAWTDPAQLEKWFAPKNYSIRFANADIKPGGESLYCLVSLSGLEIWHKIFYNEVTAPTRLVYSHCYSCEEDTIMPRPMVRDWPLEVLTTVTLVEIPDKTRLELKLEPHNAGAEEIRRFADSLFETREEWSAILGQLKDYLAAD